MLVKDSKLKQLCNENVYRNNVFHILGVSTSATPRQLRRRRDDLEASHALGSDDWAQDFMHLHGSREIPTYQEVCDAFDRMEDPEERIVSAFFWFWPDESGDAWLTETPVTLVQNWEKTEHSSGNSRIIAIHNLAVLYHLYAIDVELQIIVSRKKVPDVLYSTMCEYWDKSFSYWELLADDDDFWDLFAERVKEFDDPRLTGGFVRRFRTEFPVAFDNINAHLAAEYAKMDAYAEAKRHVDYMLKTMSGLDDVQSTLNVLFEPMENKVKRLVSHLDGKLEQSAKSGIECAQTLLDETLEIRRVAIGMLAEGQEIRTALLSEIARSCNRYCVTYGNDTKDWAPCLNVLQQLLPFACTPELKKTVQSNIDIVKKNIEEKNLYETCWFCKANKADSKYNVAMYGDVKREWGRVKYRHYSVEVPICSNCKSNRESSESKGYLWGCGVGIVFFIICCCITPAGFIMWGILGGAITGIIASFVGKDNDFQAKYETFPEIKMLRKRGWEFGDEPPKQ